MKFTTLALTAATTAAAVAAAQPHGHYLHRHAHDVKRDFTVTENAPGPTVIVGVLNGKTLPYDEVCSGIANGNYRWADGAGPAGACAVTATSTSLETQSAALSSSLLSSSAAPSSESIHATSSSAADAKFYKQSSSLYSPSTTASSSSLAPSSTAATSSIATTSSSVAASSTVVTSSFSVAAAQSSVAASPSYPANSSSGSSTYGGSGMDTPFPDGQLSCSTFPSQYGAVPIDYLQMGGWAGLQAITVSGNTVSNIVTGIAGQTCSEGMMCSYACPPGYQKSQWPSTQGSTGQSVGGISCSGGKLHLTNTALSTNLCIPGTGGVKATNNAGKVVSICRTDYPGTESETIPTVLQAGSTEELTCPDAGSYYTWEGKSTSAQYYLNPPGYDASSACQWGDASQPLGNFAPMNFGVGKKDGVTWLSMFPNKPTTSATYPNTVEIQGDISGSCKYQNGMFYNANGANPDGCTVSLTSGEATYVIS